MNLKMENSCKIHINFTFSAAISNFFKSIQMATDQVREVSFRDMVSVLALTTISDIFEIFFFVVLLGSLNINLCMFNIGWIRSAMLLSPLVPLSFSGLGIHEGATLFIFQNYGIAPETALAIFIARI